MADDEAVKVKVGVVLDSNSLIGKMGLSFMDMALSDFYEFHKNYNTRLTLFPKNSMGDDLEATAAGFNLIPYHVMIHTFSPSFGFNLFFLTKQL